MVYSSHQHRAFAVLLGIRGASLDALGHEIDCCTPPPLFIGAYFQIFPNNLISMQSIFSASGSNQAAPEPQLWLQFFFSVKNQNCSFFVEPEQTKGS